MSESSSRLLSVWNSTLVAALLLSFATVATLWTLTYSPLPGISVAVLAAAAALMSLRPDMKPWEKSAWCLLVGGLLVAEIRAIRRDRKENDQAQADSRRNETKQFRGIADKLAIDIDNNQKLFAETIDRLNTALSTLQVVLREASETRKNTAAHADLQFTKVSGGGPDAALNLLTTLPIHTNVWYRNNGNAAAIKSMVAFHYYIGKLDDVDAQRDIKSKFELAWKNLARPMGTIAPQKQDIFNTFIQTFSTEELRSVERGSTIYFVVRIRYSDGTGEWLSDECEAFQDPKREMSIAHPCVILNEKRYKAGK